jgi:hypothetical protein
VPTQPRKSPAVKPIYVLIACLCVVAALFIGAMVIGFAVVQANKNSGATVQTDQSD